MSVATSLIYLFSVIGLLNTTYLVYHKIRGTDVKCLFFPKKWCRKVQYSKYSKTFGIPNSVAGFFFYLAIIILMTLFIKGFIVFFPAQVIIIIGFLFSLYFMYVQAFILKAYCTWCVLSFVNFSVMFVFMWFV